MSFPPANRDTRRGSKRAVTVLSALLGIGAVAAAGVVLVAGTSHKSSNGSATTQPTSGAASPTATAVKVNVAPPRNWKLAFNSNFSASSTLDAKAWSTCYWWAAPNGCTNFGNLGEKEWYQASQVRLSGGIVHLVAQHTPTTGVAKDGKPKEYSCRSGMISTQPSFNFKYGMVQLVARLPYNKGLWSAFWLAAANKKWPPEIDVFEHWDTDPHVRSYVHAAGAAKRQGGPVPTPADLSKGWHTFTLNWTKTRITWYIDSYQVLTMTTGIPQQPMYLIANVADTSLAANACSGSMLIKSIKVWQP